MANDDMDVAQLTLLASLRRWRSDAVIAGVSNVERVWQEHLVEIVRWGARDPSDIAEFLPADARHLAEEISMVVGAAEPVAEEVPADTVDRSTADTGDETENETAETADDDADVDPLAGLQFADYDWPAHVPEPAQASITKQTAEAVALGWAGPDPAPPTVIYRVVTSEADEPLSPDQRDAEQIAVTTEPAVHDPRPFRSSVRHVTIWRHDGDTVDEAAARPPRLHARTTVVGPVADLQIEEHDGRIVGRWRALPGTSYVRIVRVPVGAVTGRPDDGDPIFGDTSNLTGFVDTDVSPGRGYRYTVQAAAVMRDMGTRLSAPVVCDVLMSADPEQVTDLTATQHGRDTPEFTLTWTAPPAGNVLVYRTPHPPRAGAADQVIAESALNHAGLPPEARLPQGIDIGPDGASRMLRVPWPRGWARSYFTPVTIVDGRARVGPSSAETRIGPIRHTQIVDRTERQLITLEWPDGAAAVHVFRGPRGQAYRDDPDARPDDTASFTAYVNQGGVHLRSPLPAHGCAVHLVPVSFADGERIVGDAVTLEYEGLLRMRYQVTPNRSFFRPKAHSVTVRISAEIDIMNAPPFALVHNPARLPLDIYDGTPLLVSPAGHPSAVGVPRFVPPRLPPDWSGSDWAADVGGRTGYVRLFVDLPAERYRRVALIDPPVTSLRLG